MVKSSNRIPFGKLNDVLVDVSEVSSGLACGCICPECGGKLQANKGDKVSHYFSHDPSADTSDCVSAFETSIHLMAKQILSEDGYSVFPSLKVSLTKDNIFGETHSVEMSVEDEGRVYFDRVELEKRIESIRPDIVTYIDGAPLLVEVYVTHQVDRDKKKLIRRLGLPAIEIDLSDVDYYTSESDLRELINGSPSKKTWLSNPKAIGAKQELMRKLEEEIRIREDEIRQKRKANETRIREYKTKKSGSYSLQPSAFNAYSPRVHKEYSTRWFLCEACRHLFSVPTSEAPYSLDTIPCPECDHAVIAKPNY